MKKPQRISKSTLKQFCSALRDVLRNSGKNTISVSQTFWVKTLIFFLFTYFLMNRNKVHQCIDHMDTDGSKFLDMQLLSDTIISYFVERPIRIHTSIPNSPSHYYHLYRTNDTTMPFFYAKVEEILKTITDMNKYGDFDGILTNFLKLC